MASAVDIAYPARDERDAGATDQPDVSRSASTGHAAAAAFARRINAGGTGPVGRIG